MRKSEEKLWAVEKKRKEEGGRRKEEWRKTQLRRVELKS